MFSLALDDDLRLQLFERRHARELFALIDQNRATLHRWFPWVERTTSPDDVAAFIDRSLVRFAQRDGFEGGLRWHGRLVGGLGVHNVDRDDGSGEIGYWLAQSAQGQGLMTRAVAALVRHLFEEEGFVRVEIRCDPDNVRSCAVPERLGFQLEGRLRRAGLLRGRPFDHAVYGLLDDEWRAGRDAARPLFGADAGGDELGRSAAEEEA